MRKVTKLQQKIINQMLIDSSMGVCAKVVGCRHDYVRQCMVKPHVIMAMKEHTDRVATIVEKQNEGAAIDAAWVLTAAVKVYDRCMQTDPVLDKDGNETGEYRFEHAGANKAIDTIAKHRAVNAYQPDKEAPQSPSDVHWTVEIVHTSKEEYDRRMLESSEKPPIEHQP